MDQIREQLNWLMEDTTMNKGALKDKIGNLTNSLSFWHKFLHQMAES